MSESIEKLIDNHAAVYLVRCPANEQREARSALLDAIACLRTQRDMCSDKVHELDDLYQAAEARCRTLEADLEETAQAVRQEKEEVERLKARCRTLEEALHAIIPHVEFPYLHTPSNDLDVLDKARAALYASSQPAVAAVRAVTDDMTERGLDAWFDCEGWRYDTRANYREFMRAALEAALEIRHERS